MIIINLLNGWKNGKHIFIKSCATNDNDLVHCYYCSGEAKKHIYMDAITLCNVMLFHHKHQVKFLSEH